ncbi:MAG: tetratricopeptide repeat protein [Bdellovibrionota bacterium]
MNNLKLVDASWRCLFFATLLSMASLFLFSQQGKAANSVERLYRQATYLIKKDRLKAAEKVLNRIIDKYPNHIPSGLLMARIQYRLGQTKKAFKLFSRVPLGYLDSTTAFEYGTVAYELKHWRLAINAFNLVATNDELYVFAQYYLGICYLKLRQYKRALTVLQNSFGLPPSLNSNRLKLMKVARDRINLESHGTTFRLSPNIAAPPPSVLGWAPLPPEPGSKKLRKKKVISGPATGFSFSLSPEFKWLNEKTHEEYSGTAVKDLKKNSYTEGLGITTQYDMKPFSFGGQPNFGLDANFSLSQTENSNTDVKIFRMADSTNEEEVKNSESPETNAFVFQVKPNATLPVSKNIEASFSYQYGETWPERDTNQMKDGESTPQALLNITLGKFNIGTSLSHSTYSSAEKGNIYTALTSKTTVGVNLKSVNLGGDFTVVSRESATSDKLGKSVLDTVASANIGLNLKDFSLSLALKNTELTPEENGGMVSGSALSRLETTGTASLSLGFGLSLSLTGTFATFSNYGRNDVVIEKATMEGEEDKVESVVTNGNDYGYTVSGKIAPIDWLFFTVAYSTMIYSYQYENPEIESYFYQIVPDYKTVMTISAGISKTF